MNRLAAASIACVMALSGCQCTPTVEKVQPDLEMPAQSLNFGDVALNTPSPAQNVHASAETEATVTFTATIEDDAAGVFAFSAATPVPTSIPPRGTIQIPVIFTPKAVMPYAATLVITWTNAPTQGLATSVHKVPLTGAGESPSIAVTPNHLGFSAVACPPTAMSPRCEDTETVTITNTGMVSLTLGVVSIVADGTNPLPANLNLAMLVSTSVLVPGQMLQVPVLWRPQGNINPALSEVGDFTANLQIPSNDPAHPMTEVALAAHSDPAPAPLVCLSTLSVQQPEYSTNPNSSQPIIQNVNVPASQWLDPMDPTTIHVAPGMNLTFTSLRVDYQANTATHAWVTGSAVLANPVLSGQTLSYSVPVAGVATAGTFTFPSGTLTDATDVATAIGASIPGVTAADDGSGHLQLESTATGSAQTITILATGTANAVLGFSTTQATVGAGSDGAPSMVDMGEQQADPCTVDPSGLPLTLTWSATVPPTSGAGVMPMLDDGITGADGSILIDTVGQYQVQLTVQDSLQLTASQTLNIDAQPRDDLLVQLTWTGAVGTDIDLDLHLLVDSGPDTSMPFTDPPILFCWQDCFWDNRTPTWFTGAGTNAAEIPQLLRDDQGNSSGIASHESVNLVQAPQPPSAAGGSHFQVAVHYWQLSGTQGDVTPSVTLTHLNDPPITFMPSAPMTAQDQVWYAADVVFPPSTTTCAPTCTAAPCDCPPIITALNQPLSMDSDTGALLTEPYGHLGQCVAQ